MTLLTGNFCILDVVQTLRVAQLKAENRVKSSSVVRVDVMNRALHTQALEAEAEARLSRRFLANISHELRTPLNSVIAFNSLVLEDHVDHPCSDPSHGEYCAAALTAAESLLGIINQVLDYTQLENEMQLSSRLELENELFSLKDVCDELLDVVSSRVNVRKVDLTIDLDRSLLTNEGGDMLIGDSFRLRQCLTNLCDNAIKFSKDIGGEVVVKVFFEKKIAENKSEDEQLMKDLVIEVIDNGMGIDPEKHFLLFKPFSQVNSEMARTAHGGTGLGLAITKSIVESMKGTVRCISEGNGSGSTFRMVIPAQLPDKAQLDLNFVKEASLKNVKDVKIRLALCKAPSTEILMQMLGFWGVKEKNVTDLCFTGLIPSGKDMERILSNMKADGGASEQVVWIVDSSVIIGMLNKHSPDAAAKQLSDARGIIVGHLDEQTLLRKGLGVIGQDTLAAWRTITRPIKHRSLLTKLISAVTETQQNPVVNVPKWMTSSAMRNSINSTERVPAPEQDAASKTRILLVDDHIVNQKVALRMIQRLLGAANVDVHVAGDGFEAIGMVEKYTPTKGLYHVILMDVQMPGCDGLEATRKIREWEIKTKTQRQFICALTAHANKSDVEHCLNAGMDKYMSKPLNLEDFREMLLVEIPGRSSKPGK